MTRAEATQDLRQLLNEYGLQKWSIRLNQNPNSHFLGMCSHKDETIILSAHHVDIHPTADVKNTNRHELAHALTPGHGHDSVWEAKAREVGCDNTLPCSTLSLSPEIIDAIRSGADVEVTFEEQVIRTPRYNITRLQDKCDECGRVAKTAYEHTEIADDFHPDIKVVELECGHFIVRSLPKGTPFHLLQYGGDPTCEHMWKKNVCLLCGRFKPFEYQLEGMRFGEAALAVNNGVGIFDEMGLGKTQQALGIVKFNPALHPTLYLVKAGLVYQFLVSTINWQGTEFFPQVITSSKDALIPGLKAYIISYDMLVPKSRTLKSGAVVIQGFDITKFDKVGIKCVVLDECQQIKNADSSRTQMVRRVVKGRKVIALSGTPWKNRGSELFPVLNMLDHMKFHSEEAFKRYWVDYYYQGAFRKEGGIRRIPQFKEYIKNIVIRRERTEVMSELPLVNRTKLYVTMDVQQESIYDEAVDAFVKWYEAEIDNLSGMAIIAAMQKMRHLVALAKIPATMEYVDEFAEDTDRKLVIFAHHRDVQEMLFQQLKNKYTEFPVLRLTADMSGQERFAAQECFNSSPRALMVASTLAAGEGLNLQTCADCVIHERQWNSMNEEQAEGRFIRIGQTATSVSAVYAHMDGLTTIDPQLDAIVERKRVQFHNVHNNSEMARWNEDSIMKDLAATIVNAHKSKKRQ